MCVYVCIHGCYFRLPPTFNYLVSAVKCNTLLGFHDGAIDLLQSLCQFSINNNDEKMNDKFVKQIYIFSPGNKYSYDMSWGENCIVQSMKFH